uniref:Uncharacterized protein n=1 Tax=Anopheles dirus TaxID=7168 RepID=A0A182NPH2_9DIPT
MEARELPQMRRVQESGTQRLEKLLEAVIERLDNGPSEERSRPRWHPSSTGYGYQDDTHDLSRSQMSARQAISAKLPSFDGNPEDWPNFEASFEETTRLCGYSDGENVVRLRQALKGKALKAVQSRLRRAEHLDEAMQTLRNTFGRPESVRTTAGVILLDAVGRHGHGAIGNLSSRQR